MLRVIFGLTMLLYSFLPHMPTLAKWTEIIVLKLSKSPSMEEFFFVYFCCRVAAAFIIVLIFVNVIKLKNNLPDTVPGTNLFAIGGILAIFIPLHHVGLFNALGVIGIFNVLPLSYDMIYHGMFMASNLLIGIGTVLVARAFLSPNQEEPEGRRNVNMGRR